MFEINPNLLKAVLLLTLAVSGNFVGNTLSCKTQFYMTNNMVVKHLVLLFIIYFTLSFTSTDNNPIEFMKTTGIIWVAYLLFTKQNIQFTGVSAILLFATYVIDTFVSYYKTKKEETNGNELDNKIDNLTKARTFSFYGGIILIIIGFCYYMYEKYMEYGSNFNPLTFILGKTQCNSLA